MALKRAITLFVLLLALASCLQEGSGPNPLQPTPSPDASPGVTVSLVAVDTSDTSVILSLETECDSAFLEQILARRDTAADSFSLTMVNEISRDTSDTASWKTYYTWTYRSWTPIPRVSPRELLRPERTYSFRAHVWVGDALVWHTNVIQVRTRPAPLGAFADSGIAVSVVCDSIMHLFVVC
jgi:hypothetical protein